MAATQFAVVYGTTSKIIRRIIEPDQSNLDDGHIALAQANLAPGESLVALTLSDFPVRTRATVQGKVGVPTSSGCCAQIDGTGKVVNVIQADPIIDAVPGHTLVQTDVAGIGWTFLAGAFAAPVVQAPV